MSGLPRRVRKLGQCVDLRDPRRSAAAAAAVTARERMIGYRRTDKTDAGWGQIRRPLRGHCELSLPPVAASGHDCCARGWLASASVVESEVVRGLVRCLSRGPEPVRAGAASWALGSVERAGDLGVASRARGLPATTRPSADRPGRSRVAGRAESRASASGMVDLLGAAGDVAALAPGAGGAALDVSEQAAGAAAACTAAAALDPAARAREPALGLSTDRRRAQESGARRLADHRAQGLGGRRRSAGARARTTVVAVIPAPAGCQCPRL
jgi:hypothetical protein